MYKIKTLNKIDQIGLDCFTDNYSLVDEGNVDALLVRSYKMHDMDFNDSLKAIGRAGAGVNNIPIEKCSENGVVVFNTPGANANAVKELVIAGLLLSSRKIFRSIEWAKTLDGEGKDIAKLVESGKSNFAGSEINGKTLGVIGLGAIGVMVANAASSLGMNVIGYDPFISVNAAWGLSRKVKREDSLDDLIKQSEYITVHVPLLDDTKNIINKEKFNLMNPGIKLLNFSRAGLVNEDDLLEAIERGIVDRYVTDFPGQKILNNENIINIPHLGASTPESEANCAVMAVKEISDYLENGNISNSVNYPECNMGIINCVSRITLNHKNIPSMVGKITNILAEKNINIKDMNNRSRESLAYTVLDVEDDVDQETLKKLESIEGVVKVRILK